MSPAIKHGFGHNTRGNAQCRPAKGGSTDPNIISDGYAISNTASLFGEWTGYSKVVNFTADPGQGQSA
jgi:hypothetical protein